MVPILPIITYPDPILSRKAKKIKDPLDPEIQKLIPAMIKTMRQYKGAGLAAPQIGKSIRLCVIGEGENLHTLINPQIKSRSRKKILGEEGCLSFPGKFFPVKRSEEVKVRYLNEKGEKAKIKAVGLLARIIQHEINHLDGILVIDILKKNIKQTNIVDALSVSLKNIK